jgi:D-tyrosyl-tRNA(Tyr) deacylase
MRLVLQRVKGAEVKVEGQTVGKVGKGLVVFLGVRNGDGESDAKYLAEKVTKLRVFEDTSGKFNLSIMDVGGEVLVVSQFTLYGDCRKGRRPSFTQASPPEEAIKLYQRFVALLQERGLRVETGVFGSRMLVEIQNQGPVTFVLES